MKKIFPLLLLPLISGCVYVNVPGKFTYVAPAFGTKTINKVDLTKGTLEGYSSDQTQIGEAIGIGVAAGIKAMKP